MYRHCTRQCFTFYQSLRIRNCLQAFYPYLNGGYGGHEIPSQMTKNGGMGAYTLFRLSFEHDINMGNFAQYKGLCGSGIHVEKFPPAVAAAPFIWEVLKSEYNMKFMGGVACIVQDPHTLALRPELAWGIVDLGIVEPGVLSG